MQHCTCGASPHILIVKAGLAGSAAHRHSPTRKGPRSRGPAAGRPAAAGSRAPAGTECLRRWLAHAVSNGNRHIAWQQEHVADARNLHSAAGPGACPTWMPTQIFVACQHEAAEQGPAAALRVLPICHDALQPWYCHWYMVASLCSSCTFCCDAVQMSLDSVCSPASHCRCACSAASRSQGWWLGAKGGL